MPGLPALREAGLPDRQVQGGRVKMYAYTSNEANEEDGMAEASLKILVL